MKQEAHPYVHALGFDALTRFYDAALRLLGESRFRRALVAQARIEPSHRVLDLACGTATLTLLAKQEHPDAHIVGLDGDGKPLAIARRKIGEAGAAIPFQHGLSFALPYADDSFERILSCLFFHHLTTENKRRTFEEAFRVLRPGGELHVADWGRPQDVLMRVAFFSVQLLDGFETTRDHRAGRLPDLMHDAGFEAVEETQHFNTLTGTLALYRVRKPQI